MKIENEEAKEEWIMGKGAKRNDTGEIRWFEETVLNLSRSTQSSIRKLIGGHINDIEVFAKTLNELKDSKEVSACSIQNCFH
jgi:hypothetical protein